MLIDRFKIPIEEQEKCPMCEGPLDKYYSPKTCMGVFSMGDNGKTPRNFFSCRKVGLLWLWVYQDSIMVQYGVVIENLPLSFTEEDLRKLLLLC